MTKFTIMLEDLRTKYNINELISKEDNLNTEHNAKRESLIAEYDAKKENLFIYNWKSLFKRSCDLVKECYAKWKELVKECYARARSVLNGFNMRNALDAELSGKLQSLYDEYNAEREELYAEYRINEYYIEMNDLYDQLQQESAERRAQHPQ